MRTIVHVSDLHFGRLDRALVAPLVAAITGIAPDLVAISGDLTQRARPEQFAGARAFLDALPFPRLVVAGNHDVPLYDLVSRFLRPLARYRRFICDDLEPVFVDEELIVVGLNSVRSLARSNSGGGRLNEEEVRRAADRLRNVAPALIKIVVTHHPFDLPADHAAGHLVGRAKMAMTQLAAVGADLFLAGHLHVSHIGHSAERYKIAGHSALVVQAGTLSTRQRGQANSFNVLRLSRPDITVAQHTWDESRQAFVESAARRFRHAEAGWAEVRSTSTS